MSGSERASRKREARIKQRNKERQDLFASDYVKHKYPGIYAEAVQVFQILTNQYPNKYDARKTDEHKAWKTTDPSILHPAFNIRQAVVLPPQTHVKIYFPEQTPNPEPLAIMEPPIIEPPNPEPSHQTPNPEPLAITEPPIIEPPNPEPSHQTPNPEPLAIMEPPTTEPPNPEPSPTTESPTHEPQESPEPPTPPKPSYVDNMQLIIPLLKPPKKHSGLITQTLDIVTEETLQTGQQPLRMEQLDPQILEQLMAELRADPMLKDIFSDLEQQIEFEGPDGMDIDIDIGMDTRLEDQLENWEFW